MKIFNKKTKEEIEVVSIESKESCLAKEVNLYVYIKNNDESFTEVIFDYPVFTNKDYEII